MMMKLDLQKYDPLRKDITRLLREAIIRGELLPGERLIEPEIADKLGVSRTPVREALLKLEAEGFLRVIPRKGAVVAPFSITEACEIYEILIEIESFAAQKSVELLKSDDIRAIIALEEKFERSTDQVEKIEANTAFHHYYIESCGNSMLADIVTNLNHKLDRYRRLVFIDAGRVVSAQLEHKKLIDAFKARDAAKVYRLIKRHLTASKKSLIHSLEKIKVEGGKVED